MQRQEGEEWGVGEKPNPKLITEFLQCCTTNTVAEQYHFQAVTIGNIWRPFQNYGFLLFSEMIILFVCMLVHAGAQGVWDLAFTMHMKLDNGLPPNNSTWS